MPRRTFLTDRLTLISFFIKHSGNNNNHDDNHQPMGSSQSSITSSSNGRSNLERRSSNPTRPGGGGGAVERRPSNPRSRQKRVLVSLPMIKLEISMDRDSDFLDFSASSTNNNNSNNNNNNSSHNGDNIRNNNVNNNNNNIMENNEGEIPDLIKSLQRSTPRTSPVEENPPLPMMMTQHQDDEGGGGGDGDEFDLRDRRDDYREQDSFSDTESIDEMKEDAILKELNNHLSKALSEGNHPQWLYEIKEHEDDTWC